MKRHILMIFAVVLLMTTTAFAAKPFPDFELTGKLTPAQKSYLGVESETIKLTDIKADYVFIEGYSMYCPICQRDAPGINDLYETVSSADPEGKIKIIGIALGNTPLETSFYAKKYNVEFPIFTDENYIIHEGLGNVGTPVFYIVKLGSTPEMLYMHEGEAKDKAILLQALKDKAGLK